MARAKQMSLPGVKKPEVIQELEEACEKWDEKVDSRMVMTTEEVALKKNVIRIMQRHKIETYRMANGTTVQMTAGEPNVKRIKDGADAKKKGKKDDAPAAD